ncbi:MAG: DUF1847 domain-containing protein [Fretibacterium sp.]|nr:DUF1847 domain-containing protein [Fretibacterium sp.]
MGREGADAIYDRALELTNSAEHNEFYVKSSEIEKDFYGSMPRVRETIELIKRMGYSKVGLAFCSGLVNEARIFSELCREHGINIIGVMCKSGGKDKTETGLGENKKLKPGQFEAMCNPVGQALMLNEMGTEFNVVMGLCVGHDSLFYKFSEALCTTVLAKDRVTGHNPVVALYQKDGYFKNKLK